MRSLHVFVAVPLLIASALPAGAIPAAGQPAAREQATLASNWRFQMDADDLGEKERWYAGGFDRSVWTSVPVPKAWDLYDQALWGYEGIGWYTTSIPGSLARAGKMQRLRFGRVNYYTKAWLNGEPLGENVGGYLPFEFEVTGKLRSDKPNVLVLRVDNRPRLEWLPAAKEIEWIQYGGVLQPVILETNATTYVPDVTINAVPQGSGATVACKVAVRNAGASDESVMVRVDAAEFENSRQSVPVTVKAGATDVHAVSLSLARANRWSPQSPALYTLRVSIERGGKLLDRTEARFGIRRVEVRGREILLNGERIRLKGVNRYDEYGKYGPNPPRALVIEDLKRMKATGINAIRVHYPQSPELLSLYDEMGFMMIEELPINWWGNNFSGRGEEVQSESILSQAVPMLEKMIRRDKNHPAIIIWSMANESRTDTAPGTRVMRALIRRTKDLDPSKPVTFVTDRDAATQRAYEDADLVAINLYPGVFSGDIARHASQLEELVRKPAAERIRSQLAAFPSKPFIVTEFGNRGVHTIHGDVVYSEDFQAAYIETAWKAIQEADELSGGVLWCWADYFHRRKFIQYAVFGPYGVVTVDRQPKAALRALARMYGGTVQ